MAEEPEIRGDDDDATYRSGRKWHRLYAMAMGLFWLPCPICGENFGGHEYVHSLLDPGAGSGQGICTKDSCIREAHRRNRATMVNAGYLDPGPRVPGFQRLKRDTPWWYRKKLRQLGVEIRDGNVFEIRF